MQLSRATFSFENVSLRKDILSEEAGFRQVTATFWQATVPVWQPLELAPVKSCLSTYRPGTVGLSDFKAMNEGPESAPNFGAGTSAIRAESSALASGV